MTQQMTREDLVPLRVPLSRLRASPGGLLEAARERRVLLTRRGKVVGELVSREEPLPVQGRQTPARLSGALASHLRLAPGVDLTASVDVAWDALE